MYEIKATAPNLFVKSESLNKPTAKPTVLIKVIKLIKSFIIDNRFN